MPSPLPREGSLVSAPKTFLSFLELPTQVAAKAEGAVRRVLATRNSSALSYPCLGTVLQYTRLFSVHKISLDVLHSKVKSYLKGTPWLQK